MKKKVDVNAFCWDKKLTCKGIALSKNWAIAPRTILNRETGVYSFHETEKSLYHRCSGVSAIDAATQSDVLSFWRSIPHDVKGKIELEDIQDIVNVEDFVKLTNNFYYTRKKERIEE